MKKRNLLVVALTAFTLLSCSKESAGDLANEQESISLALSVSTRNMTASRAMEGEATIDKLDIQSMVIELYNVKKVKIGEAKVLTLDEIGQVTDATAGVGDATRIVLEQVSKEAVYARIYAYQKKDVIATTDMTQKVNNFQKGFDAVPFNVYEGTTASPYDATTDLIKINKSTTPAPGPSTEVDHKDHKIWTIEAKMSACLARFEVKGAIAAADLAPMAGGNKKPWAAIAVTGIYINNINDNMGDAALRFIDGNHQNWGRGDWATGHPYKKADGDWSNLFDIKAGEEVHATANSSLFTSADVAAAYQIFPQGGANANGTTVVEDAVPHIIVRLLITPDKAVDNREPYYAFITLKKFLIVDNKGNDTYLNVVERGKVYRINLAVLAPLMPGDLDPDPESSVADLYAKITIDKWSDVHLKPEL